MKHRKEKSPRIGSAVIRGRKERYEFQVFPLDVEMQPVPAVYVISRRVIDRDGRGHHKFVCIGQTESLALELKKHRKGKCLKKFRANVVSVLPTESEKARFSIEADLKAAHSIPCRYASEDIAGEIVVPVEPVTEPKPEKKPVKTVVETPAKTVIPKHNKKAAVPKAVKKTVAPKTEKKIEAQKPQSTPAEAKRIKNKNIKNENVRDKKPAKSLKPQIIAPKAKAAKNGDKTSVKSGKNKTYIREAIVKKAGKDQPARTGAAKSQVKAAKKTETAKSSKTSPTKTPALKTKASPRDNKSLKAKIVKAKAKPQTDKKTAAKPQPKPVVARLKAKPSSKNVKASNAPKTASKTGKSVAASGTKANRPSTKAAGGTKQTIRSKVEINAPKPTGKTKRAPSGSRKRLAI